MVPRWQFGNVDLTDYPFLTEFGADHGTPDATTEVLASFLSDGDIEITSRRGNRTIVLPILIEGSDQLELAEALARLEAECRKPTNELLVDPGDGFGPPSVFRTFETASLVWNREDNYERANVRSYTLTLRALSYAYSAEETVVEALGPPPPTPAVEVSVDSGTTTTGWDAGYNNSPLTPATSVNAGRTLVGTTTPATAGTVRLYVRRTGAVDVSVTKYIVVDWAYSGGYPVGGLSAAVTTGTPLTLEKVSEGASPVAGDMRTVFKVPVSVSSLADLTFTHVTTGTRGGTGGFSDLISQVVSRSLFVDQITRADKVGVANGKQQLRSFDVGGSAPTTGSIELAHSTTALGDAVHAFTYPADGAAAAGYTPQATQFRIAGGPTVEADATSVSGFRTLLDSTDYFSFPALALPDGEYAIWAILKSVSATAVINWTLTPHLQGATQIGATEPHATTVALGGSVYKPVPLGNVHLPLIDTGLQGATMIGVGSANPGADDVYLAELLLYNVSLGVLTVVNMGSGTAAVGGPSRRLWIDSPSIANEGLGAMMRGHSTDRSDSFSAYPTALAPGVHRFTPGPMKMHLITPNTDGVQASFRYTKAWLHTAAE